MTGWPFDGAPVKLAGSINVTHSETIYDGSKVLADMQEQHSRVPVAYPLGAIASAVASLQKSHHAKMLRQTSNGLREIAAILDAIHAAEQAEARRVAVMDAAKGQIGPGRVLRMVGADRDG